MKTRYFAGLSPRRIAAVLVATLLTSLPTAHAADDARLDSVEKQLQDLRDQVKEKDKRLGELEAQVQRLTPDKAELEKKRADASVQLLDEMLKDQDRRNGAAPAGLLSAPIGGGSIRLIDISLDVLLNSGTSTATDQQLQQLQGGGHDPHKRGFTLSQAEIGLAGAVDPYINAEAHIVFQVDPITGETGAELEDAFLTTQTLPYGLQIKAGQYFTEFGRINPQHPHQWDWIDQPIINTRVFGPDGLRQTGARIAWLTPLPWFSELYFGVQNADGETTESFLASEGILQEQPVGGRPFVDRSTRSLGDMLYSMRWLNSWDLSDQWSLQLGASAVYGPNFTGGSGDTWIYGGDVRLKWVAAQNERGYPFVVFQSEIMRRDFNAAPGLSAGPDGLAGTGDDVSLRGDTLHDWGFYAQALWGFKTDWALGLRYEMATGSGDSVAADGSFVSHNADPFRDNRYRISPIIQWQPTHFSRVRLQYNFDHADHLDKPAHSVWVGVEFLIGAHPAHNY
jgi:hypothetical protein